MRSLLDINVVIALLDPDHDFHQRAHHWWSAAATSGWASSPITQNGVIRIMSHPAYNPRRSLTPDAVAMLLRAFASASDHEFWPDHVSLIDPDVIATNRILGPRQVTDVYLLALAQAMDGRLVTFNAGINVSVAVANATDHLLIL